MIGKTQFMSLLKGLCTTVVFAACSPTGAIVQNNVIKTPKSIGSASGEGESLKLTDAYPCKVEINEEDAKRIGTTLENLLSKAHVKFDINVKGKPKPIDTLTTAAGNFKASYILGSSGIEKKGDEIFCQPTLVYKTVEVKVDATKTVQIVDSAPKLELVSGTLQQANLSPNETFATLSFKGSDVDKDAVSFVAEHTCGGSIQTLVTGSTLTISGTMPNLFSCAIDVAAKADGVFSTSQTISLLRGALANAPTVVLSNTPTHPNNVAGLNVTVGGTDVVEYKYAIKNNTTACSASDSFNLNWIAVATPITDTLVADGQYQLCVIGRSNLGVAQTATDATHHSWVYAAGTYPLATLSNTPAATSVASSLNVWVNGVGIADYQFAVQSGGATCSSATFNGSWISKNTAITSVLGSDGNYTLCVLGRDSTGIEQLPANVTGYAWVKDVTAPTSTEINLANAPSNPSNLNTLNVTVSGTDVVRYRYALTTQTVSCATVTYSATAILVATHITDTLGADGNYRLCILGRDAAGNETTPANAKVVDWEKNSNSATAVLSNTPASPSNATALNVSVAGTGITQYKYAVIESGTCAAATYSAAWQLIATPITANLGSDNSYTLCVIGKNAAGTEQAVSAATSANWTKDTVAPTGADIVLTGSPTSPSNATSLNVAVSGAGITNYKFALTTQASTCALASYSPFIATSTNITANLGADGNLRLCVVTQDVAGNETTAASAKQFDWIKNTSPALATLSGAPNSPSSETALDVTIGGTDIVSYKYAIISSGSCAAATYNASFISVASAITDVLGADNSYTLCVVGKNLAGTQQAAGSATQHTWTKDTTAPTAAEITLAGTPSTISNLTALNVTVGGTGVVKYKFAITTQATTCAAATYNATWRALATSITDTLGSDGTLRLCVIGQDAAGNATTIATAKQFDWTKNTTAVAATLSGQPSNPSSVTALNVTVAGTDVVSYKYAIITSGGCATATYNASWITVATPITDTLAADNSFTLCVIGKNTASTEQAVAAATTHIWTKDTIAPTNAEITLAGTPASSSNATTLSVTVGGTGVVNYKYALTTQATTCGAATFSTSWIAVATPITETLGADGNLRLCVIGQDSVGNATVQGLAKQHTWTKNTTDALATLLGAPANPSSSTALNITVAGTDIVAYKYSLITSGSCSSATYSASWVAVATPLTEALGSDDNYTVCVIGKNTFGTEQAASAATTHAWTKDTTAPLTSDIILTGTPSDPSNAINFNVTVSGSQVYEYQFAVTDNLTNCSAATFNGTWIAVATPITSSVGTDGSKKRLCVIARDQSGNALAIANAKYYDWTKDTVAPTSAQITLTNVPGNPSNTTALNVTVGGAGVTNYKYGLTTQETACSAVIYSAVWKAIATPITDTLGSDGNLRLCVVGQDSAGNETAVGGAKEYDWQKDTASVTAIISDAPATYSNATALNVTVSGTGIVTYKHAVITSGTCAAATYSAAWVAIATPITDSIGTPDGEHTLCVIGRGGFGNEQLATSATSHTWTKDTVAPIAANISFSNAPTNPSNATALDVTVGGTDSVSYKYALTTQATSCGSATYSATWKAIATHVTDTLGADGGLRLCVITQDVAGNATANADAKQHDWSKDTSAATATLSGTPGAQSAATALNVTVSGTNIVSYKHAIITSGTCSSASYSASWTAVATGITNSLGIDGAYILCVIGKNSAGTEQLVTSATSFAWTKDTVGPAAVALTLSGTPTNPSQTTNLNVTVGGSDAVSYKFSVTTQSIACQDASYNGSWVSVSTAITDAIGADGSRRLCVIALDAAGNSTAVTAAKIFDWVKDTTPPSSSDITLSGTPSDPSRDTSLNVTVAGTGVVDYQFALTTTATACETATFNGSWIAITTPITSALGADANKIRLCVIARDSLSNATLVTNAKAFDWQKDTVAPTATISNQPTSTSSATFLNVTVSGTDVVDYKFALNDQTESCAAASYSGSWVSVATSISAAIGTDGNKRLCVLGRDTAGNTQLPANAVEYTWVKDTIEPVAVLSGTPSSISNTSAIDVTISGDQVVTYQYSVTTSATDCENATYNGTWISVSTDIEQSVAGEGEFRLCVIGRDAATNAQDKATATSHDWTKDTIAPTATISDTPDSLSNATALNVTVSGTGVVDYKFALTDQSTACAAATYSASWTVVATQITATTGADGAKRLCVIGRDFAGNAQSVASAAVFNWTKDTAPPTSTLSGTPLDPNAVSNLDVQVAGTDVVDYKYAIADVPMDCLAATYSSQWASVSTPITDAVSTDGNKRLCVIGRDTAGNAQATATEFTWVQGQSIANLGYSVNYLDNFFYRVTKESQLALEVKATEATQYGFALTQPTAPELLVGATYQCPASSNWTSVSTPMALSFPGDGLYRLCITIRNGSDTTYGPYHILKMGSSATYNDIVAQLTPPNSSVTGVPGAPTGALSVSLSVSGSDLFAYRYFVSQSATNCVGGTWSAYEAADQSLAVSQTVLNDGLVNVCVRGVSQLWIQEPEADATMVSWMRDGTLQQVEIDTSDLPASLSKTTSFTVDIASPAYPKYSYVAVSGSTCAGATGYSSEATISTPISLSVVALADGPVTLCVKGVYNNATTQATASAETWTKDTTAPVLTALDGVPSGTTNEVTHSMNLAGANDYRFALVAGLTCPTVAGSYSAYATVSNPTAFDSASLADGDISLCLAGRDPAGNEQLLTAATKYTWDKNTVASAATVTGMPTGVANQVTLNADVGGTDTVTYYYNVVAGASCGSSWTGPVAASVNITNSISGLADGTISLCVKGVDGVGNMQVSPTQKTWTKDTTAPSDMSVTGAPSGTSNAVSIDVTVSSAQATTYSFLLSDSASVCPGTPSSTYIAIANHITQSIDSLNDGTVLLCVWGKDGAGNVATVVQRTWTKQMLTCGATPHNGTTTRTRYQNASVPYGSSCVSQSQTGTCYNGVLTWTGTYAQTSCTVQSPANCTVNGTAVNHGNSKTFYTASVASSCSGQSRTCTNGTMSGTTSYQYATCRVYNNCTLNGATVNHGSSATFYSVQTSATCTSYDLTRTCTDGTLSGSSSYQYSSCTLPACAAGGFRYNGNCFYVGSVGQSCTTVCSARGGCNATTTNSLRGTDCLYVGQGLGYNYGSGNVSGTLSGSDWPGCAYLQMNGTTPDNRWSNAPNSNTCGYTHVSTVYYTNGAVAYSSMRRYCGCNN